MSQHYKILICALSVATSVLVSGCSDGSSSDQSSGANGQNRTGTAGSTARMVIDGDYLYAISGDTIQLINISSPAVPNVENQVVIDWDIETLFPYKNYLLVGATDGIHILDNSDPASPQPVGDFQHAQTRDPVVAQNDVAYATLRRDDSQPGTDIINQLNVIDISNVEAPELVQVQELTGPLGLAVRGENLYVCDGAAGLKIFDIADKLAPVATRVLPNVICNDVIATSDTLHLIGPDDYSQYSTSLSSQPLLMSKIAREPVIYLVDR